VDVAKTVYYRGKSAFVNGPAGTGKTEFIQALISLIGNEKIVQVLAPTNIAANAIDGITIDKFLNAYLNKDFSKIRKKEWFIIDEISMVKEKFYNLFLAIKQNNPNAKFIICGDFYQLDPVS
jgi:predicted AAA+ superfamily ATPase